MASERRYGEDEVRRIFEQAARDEISPANASSAEGLTLRNLEEIGAEVGIPPEKIRQAAQSLDGSNFPASPSDLSRLPITVSRCIDLPRAPDEREWEILVSFIRETFGARGRMAGHGGLREWVNGNLRISLEPSTSGHRLRMGTRKGSAVAALVSGTLGVLVGLLALLLTFVLDTGETFLMGAMSPLLLLLVGTAVVASAVVRLPGWARTREAQMEEVGRYALTLLESGRGKPSSH